MKYYSSIGTLNYSPSGWLILKTSNSISQYYHFWVQKFTGKKASTPLHESHVTVIAGKYLNPSSHPNWGKYQGWKLQFEYSSDIWTENGDYFWLRVECPRLGEIRKELDLSPNSHHPYHLTVAYISPDSGDPWLK